MNEKKYQKEKEYDKKSQNSIYTIIKIKMYKKYASDKKKPNRKCYSRQNSSFHISFN